MCLVVLETNKLVSDLANYAAVELRDHNRRQRKVFFLRGADLGESCSLACHSGWLKSMRYRRAGGKLN